MSENLAEIKCPSKIKLVAKLHCPDVECERQNEPISCGTLKKYEAISSCDRATTGTSLEVELLLEPVLAKLVWREVNESGVFQRGLISWIFQNWTTANQGGELIQNGVRDYQGIVTESNICQLYLAKKRKTKLLSYQLNVNIKLLTPRPVSIEPDVKWCRRLYPSLLEQVQLQVVMSWLSTLGGAYSALGDYFSHHSEKAGWISMKQLQIASRLGDPVMASQCKVFVAMSLVQRGRLKQAARIVREQYSFALSNGACKDEKLVATCKSVWIRIKFLKKQHQVMKECLNEEEEGPTSFLYKRAITRNSCARTDDQ